MTDFLNIYHVLCVRRQKQHSKHFFVNVTLASTFVNVTLAWLELNLCHLKKREDRIFSNYSDFQRLRNKSRESKKGNIDIFLKKNYL